eukprot:2491087-Rhodomonas_salina.2
MLVHSGTPMPALLALITNLRAAHWHCQIICCRGMTLPGVRFGLGGRDAAALTVAESESDTGTGKLKVARGPDGDLKLPEKAGTTGTAKMKGADSTVRDVRTSTERARERESERARERAHGTLAEAVQGGLGSETQGSDSADATVSACLSCTRDVRVLSFGFKPGLRTWGRADGMMRLVSQRPFRVGPGGGA